MDEDLSPGEEIKSGDLAQQYAYAGLMAKDLPKWDRDLAGSQ